ncbi:MAG TPA: ADP-ribosylation/crystallin J1 [Afifellaceae bacterium]|nr:ADP-ribosylation/crystallin J1 [Afifellaceae bacterium]
MQTITLYRPVGAQELALIEESGFTAFPPRLPEQPIFYPVTNEPYATQIARDWNAMHNTPPEGYVTKSAVNADFLSHFEKKIVGGHEHEEYWIPSEDLETFNRNIIGKIAVIHSFFGAEQGKEDNA